LLHPQIALKGGRDFEDFGIAVADAMYCGRRPSPVATAARPNW